MCQTRYLVHFSLRHSDEQFVDFFIDEARCKTRLDNKSNGADEGSVPLPDIVLCLDSGPVELWAA